MVVSLVALFKDRSNPWARIGFAISLITFALWLALVLSRGF